MKAKVQEFVYDYDWEIVVDAYLSRFPTNPRIPVLLNSEIVKDETDPKSGVRHIERKCLIDFEAPRWFKAAVRIYDFMFCQRTWIDYRRKSMVITNCNISYAGVAKIYDECEYAASWKEPGKTLFEQQASMELPNVPFAQKGEAFCVKSYDKNTGEGRLIDLEFIKQLLADGSYKKPVYPEELPPGSYDIIVTQIDHSPEDEAERAVLRKFNSNKLVYAAEASGVTIPGGPTASSEGEQLESQKDLLEDKNEEELVLSDEEQKPADIKMPRPEKERTESMRTDNKERVEPPTGIKERSDSMKDPLGRELRERSDSIKDTLKEKEKDRPSESKDKNVSEQAKKNYPYPRARPTTAWNFRLPAAKSPNATCVGPWSCPFSFW
eukprot:Lithocolla_globosa_v1_NODE_4316_length_1465_cov_3.770922.p1 type:complete len:380 gc:universal NODE_4316_length_1465_cov_3.770922:1417-278(-)